MDTKNQNIFKINIAIDKADKIKSDYERKFLDYFRKKRSDIPFKELKFNLIIKNLRCIMNIFNSLKFLSIR